jgi:hypothetical protein
MVDVWALMGEEGGNEDCDSPARSGPTHIEQRSMNLVVLETTGDCRICRESRRITRLVASRR